MRRVKIRLFGEATGKVLRFDASIGYVPLLRKIVNKLTSAGVHGEVEDADLRRSFQLRLGTDAVLEDASEIEHGDDIVLLRIGDHEGDAPDKKSHAAASGKTHDESEHADDDSVQEVQREKMPLDDREVISVSSDSDEDDEDDDESLEDRDELDFWEDEEEEAPCSRNGDAKGSDDASVAREGASGAAARTRTRRRRRSNPKLPTQSPLEVIMEGKDVPSAPGKQEEDVEGAADEPSSKDDLEEASLLVSAGARKTKTDRVVKDRIIKLLNTGFHDQSNEHEAKTAMKLAQRLMRKYNLSQALLLKERDEKRDGGEGGEDEVLRGGMVRVRIVNRKTGKPSLFVRWLSLLVQPVCDNFDVKCYHQTRRSVRCDVVFYGIYGNAQLAAYAFKVAAERIAQMSAAFVPSNAAAGAASTKGARLSYALGVVHGIAEDVRRTRRREAERRERRWARARRASARGEAYEESDDEGPPAHSFPSREEDSSDEDGAPWEAAGRDDGADAGPGADADDRPVPAAGDAPRSRAEALEVERRAALVLANHAEKIAEDVLKEHEVKLCRGRKRAAIEVDARSYRQGVEDARDVDMNQRAIRDEVRVKREKRERA